MATQTPPTTRPLAVVTGASSGIGRELALIAARKGFDLLMAADTDLAETTTQVESFGAAATAVQCDLATPDGVAEVMKALADRPVAALLANAGHGLGHAFLDQEFDDVRHVIDTNITGTIYLAHQIGRRMRSAGEGRILFTGSIAGYMPGSYAAVYNASKAFIDSFSLALRNELLDTGVTVTCLMPGVTDTEFFERADMMDTKAGQTTQKDDPSVVAKAAFAALQAGTDKVTPTVKNKIMGVVADMLPDKVAAQIHRGISKPGSGQ